MGYEPDSSSITFDVSELLLFFDETEMLYVSLIPSATDNEINAYLSQLVSWGIGLWNNLMQYKHGFDLRIQENRQTALHSQRLDNRRLRTPEECYVYRRVDI